MNFSMDPVLKCALCYGIPYKAVVLSCHSDTPMFTCGAILCEECARDVPPQSQCPVCSNYVVAKTASDSLTAVCNALQRPCPYKGCSYVGTANAVAVHLDTTCRFAPVFCRNAKFGCDFSCPRRSVNLVLEHEAADCDSYPCKFYEALANNPILAGSKAAAFLKENKCLTGTLGSLEMGHYPTCCMRLLALASSDTDVFCGFVEAVSSGGARKRQRIGEPYCVYFSDSELGKPPSPEPTYTPTTPAYIPVDSDPESDGDGSPGYSPASPGYSPMSSGYSPASPGYSPASPGHSPQSTHTPAYSSGDEEEDTSSPFASP